MTQYNFKMNGAYPARNNQNREIMRDKLNKTGPGFCLAKWTQVTMHLGTGMTHSCHHPVAHKIPLEELKDNPGALHNTKHKKQARKEMLNGERPSECDFCWRIEDNTNEFSDRVLKSMDPYSFEYHDEIAQATGDENIFPKYVEVSFSNVCNFKCSYCGPSYSSKWAEELKSQGPIELGIWNERYNWVPEDQLQIKARDDNPYIEAFWKWFPEAMPHMHTFRITGGEPLLNKDTMKVLRYLLENPNPGLEIAVNSNGNPPQAIWNEFVDLVGQLTRSNSVKKFTLFVSAESTGKQAEFSRMGMDWMMFEKNVEHFLANTYNTRVTFMAAFNIFSLTTYPQFLEYVLYLKKKFNKAGMQKWLEESGISVDSFMKQNLDDTKNRPEMQTMLERDPNSINESRVGLDTPYVRAPEFLDAQIATVDLVQKYLIPSVNYMYENLCNEWTGMMGFEDWEALKLKRIAVDVLIGIKDARNPDETTTNDSIAFKRIKFANFIKQYEKRNNVNFVETFPEMQRFLDVCETEKQKFSLKKADS